MVASGGNGEHATVEEDHGWTLTVLGGFELRREDVEVRLPRGCQRLVGLLALKERPLPRSLVTTLLWADTSPRQASASLRSTLWRLGRRGSGLLGASTTSLSIGHGVAVDLKDARVTAHRALSGELTTEAETDLRPLTEDVLPGWYDDWAIVERERFRQLRLHALEALCRSLASAGRFAPAIEAGMTAVAEEPLRESAHRALIQTFISVGNRSAAIRQFEVLRGILWQELGVEPSDQSTALWRSITPTVRTGDSAAE
jgi:DNA-binding SARP family transcriptional activator